MMAEIEFDIDTYEPLPVYKPTASRKQIEKALGDARDRGPALIVAGGGIINADASDLLVEFAETDRRSGHPDADGLGRDPRRSPADGRHVRLADQPPLRQRQRCSPAISCSASATAGRIVTPAQSEVYCKGRRFVHVDIEPTQIGRVFAPDYGIVSDAKAALAALRRGGARVEGGGQAAGLVGAWVARMPASRKASIECLRKTNFDSVPMKPQRVYQCMNNAFGKDVTYVSHDRPERRSPARSSCTSTTRATGSTAARPARSAGPSRPRSACALPTRTARSSRCRATTTSSS